MISCHNCGMPDWGVSHAGMTINAFAEKRRLKMRCDECGESIIPGRQGQIYKYDGAELGVMFMAPRGRWRPKMWNKFRKAALAIGMTLRQNGDSEGCLSFDPANDAQAKLAVKIAGVRPKRRVSPEEIARLVTVGFKASRHTVEGHLGAKKTSDGPPVPPHPIKTKNAGIFVRDGAGTHVGGLKTIGGNYSGNSSKDSDSSSERSSYLAEQKSSNALTGVLQSRNATTG